MMIKEEDASITSRCAMILLIHARRMVWNQEKEV